MPETLLESAAVADEVPKPDAARGRNAVLENAAASTRPAAKRMNLNCKKPITAGVRSIMVSGSQTGEMELAALKL